MAGPPRRHHPLHRTGQPLADGYAESFNVRLRDELLNGEIFYNLEEVRAVTGWWRDHYNLARPHSSLGYRPPASETVMRRASTNYPTGPVIVGSPVGLTQRW